MENGPMGVLKRISVFFAILIVSLVFGVMHVPASDFGIPYLSGISPAEGPAAGGTLVTLSGSNFVAGAGVKFGTLSATNVVVVGSSRITCTAPANAAGGAVAVTAVNPDTQTSNSKTYTYVLGPVLSGVSPNAGSTEGGETVTLTGQRFAQGNTVTFAGRAAAITNLSSTTISVTTPANLAGPADVVVTDWFGQTGTAKVFTYIQLVRADFTADQLSGTAPLTVNFTDRSAGAASWAWEFKKDGGAVLGTPAVQNPSFTFNDPGPYTVTVTLTINGGASQLVKNGYITMYAPEDITPPVASIIAGVPEEGTATNATDYSITVGGLDVDRYTYRLSQNGGATWGPWTPDLINPLLGNWVGMPITLNGLGDAVQESVTVMLQVRGADTSNNWQTEVNATTRSWKIDIKPPAQLTLSGAPQDGSTVAMDSINVKVGGADVAYYKYRWNFGAWSNAVSVLLPITDILAGDGAKNLDVLGADAYGNWQASPITRPWTVDNTVPTAVLTVDAATPIINGVPVNILNAIFAVGGTGVTHYKYMVDTGGVQGVWSAETPVATPISLTNIAEGQYVLYVNARNAMGTWQDAASGEIFTNATTFNWWVDATPPFSASGLAAIPGTPATSSVNLVWNAAETGLKAYRLRCSTFPITAADWDAATPIFTGIVPGAAGTVERNRVTGLLSNTTYYFGLRSEDQAGNLSDLDMVSVATSGNHPTITFFSRMDGGGIAGHNGIARELFLIGNCFTVTESGTANTVKFMSTQGAGGFSALSKGVNATTLRVDVPIGAPVGTYRLQIVNANGTSALSTQTYTVTQAPIPVPDVTMIYPVTGPANAATDVILMGSNFTGVTGVVVRSSANAPVALGNVVGVSDTQITARVPAGIPKGIYEIQVTADPDGVGPMAATTNGVSATKFEVYMPVVLTTTAVSTDQGITIPPTGVVPVPIKLSSAFDDKASLMGENVAEIQAEIEPGTEITMGGAPYTGNINPPRQVPLSALSQQQQNKLGHNAVVFTMGNDAGTLQLDHGQTIFVNVQVTTPSWGRKPVVYYLNAQTGEVERAGLNPSAHWAILPYRSKIDWFRDRYEKPYQWGGSIVSKRNDCPEPGYTTYQIGLLLDHMSSFSAGAVMEITGVIPSSGTIDGGTTVTISGVNFQAGSTVTFGGEEAIGVMVAYDGTSITCATPAHLEGAMDIVVTGPDTQTASLAGGFTYLMIPSIDSITPTTGSTAGGTTVAITGTNFMPGVTVTFDGTLAPDVVTSPTLIACTTPAHAAGGVNVVVTNPNAESATAANGFTYSSGGGGGGGGGGFPLDTDQDGMPDGWEMQYGLNKLEDDAGGDLDGDGFSNLKEYLRGTLPNDSSSRPVVSPGDVDGDDLIGLSDAVTALQTMAGLNPRKVYPEADVDGDGHIGLEEAIMGLQVLSGTSELSFLGFNVDITEPMALGEGLVISYSYKNNTNADVYIHVRADGDETISSIPISPIPAGSEGTGSDVVGRLYPGIITNMILEMVSYPRVIVQQPIPGIVTFGDTTATSSVTTATPVSPGTVVNVSH